MSKVNNIQECAKLTTDTEGVNVWTFHTKSHIFFDKNYIFFSIKTNKSVRPLCEANIIPVKPTKGNYIRKFIHTCKNQVWSQKVPGNPLWTNASQGTQKSTRESASTSTSSQKWRNSFDQEIE